VQIREKLGGVSFRLSVYLVLMCDRSTRDVLWYCIAIAGAQSALQLQKFGTGGPIGYNLLNT